MPAPVSKFRSKADGMSTDLSISILDQAKELFASDGFDKVSTRDIAEKVGVKQSTLYYYFPSKQDIYNAVVLQAQNFVADRLIESLSFDEHPTKKIYRFFRTAIFVFRAAISEARIIDRELISHGEDGINFLVDTTRRPHEALAEVILEVAPDCAADHYSYFCISLAYGARRQRGLLLQLVGLDDLHDHEKLADALAAWCLRAIQPGAAGHISDPAAGPTRVAELENENDRLRRLVVKLSLEVAGLKGE